MLDDTFSAMRQSIIDGAPDTASALAQQAVAAGMAPLEAINNGFVPGMHAVGEQFAQAKMFLPDMMASAEAMRAAMAVLDPELKKLGTERPMAGRGGTGNNPRGHPRDRKNSGGDVAFGPRISGARSRG